jgi:hypothetical protein
MSASVQPNAVEARDLKLRAICGGPRGELGPQ